MHDLASIPVKAVFLHSGHLPPIFWGMKNITKITLTVISTLFLTFFILLFVIAHYTLVFVLDTQSDGVIFPAEMNSKELVELANSDRFIYAATRQNMNRLMTGEQWEYLRKRNIIESDWGVLKQNYFLEYHQARSMVGLFRHYVCCISAYILECRLKSFPRIKTRI